jgi:hypothetical protein
MTFETFCGTLVALLFGLAVCFAGYRAFLILLPIWGFIFGFALGAQALQALFGVGFLSVTISWVAGFFVGAVFAVLSYLFYFFAVALAAGSLGYELGVALLGLIGIAPGFLTFVVGVILAAIFIFVTFRYNLQKYVIIAATAFAGAGIIVGTFLLGVNRVPLTQLAQNPVQVMLQGNFLWTLIFIVLVVAGIIMQIGTTQSYELTPYENRI